MNGLAFDPRAAVRHLRASDPALGRVSDTIGPCTLEREIRSTHSVFGALAEAIVYQQLTGKAAATIFGRVCALCPPRNRLTPERLLNVSDAKLRGAGLSRAKLLAVRDLARKSLSGDVPSLARIRRLDDDAIVERLTAVRGIGRWTAEMLLIFRLGRADVLPVDDYGIRKGFALLMRRRALPSRAEMDTRARHWRPYRTVASWYLWRAVELSSRGAR